MPQSPLQPRKVLVIRLSSMGDIVLTSPVLRALRKGLPEAEIHFLVKPRFADLLKHCPYIDHLHALKPNLAHTIEDLKEEGFEYIVDLQKSLRSRWLRTILRKPSSTFDKHNATKWRMVRLKQATQLPHITQRYMQALEPLGITSDDLSLEAWPGDAARAEAGLLFERFLGELPSGSPQPYGLVVGAAHATKAYPEDYQVALINKLGQPVVLLGGTAEGKQAKRMVHKLNVPYLNAVGQVGLLTSAALVGRCAYLFTPDTGLMHVAAALGVPVFSVWGNTVPGFGMAPVQAGAYISEVAGLSCRPCSKIGYAKCPKGHFDCMRKQTPEKLATDLMVWREEG